MLCGTASANGQGVTVTTKSKPIYLGSNGAIFYDGEVQQTDAWFQWNNGVYADIWTSASFNQNWNFGKELDLTLGKVGKLGTFSYSANINYYVIVITDVANVNAELSRDFLRGKVSIEPYVRGEWYFPVRRGGPRRGIMGVGGLRTSVRMSSALSLVARGWLKKDSGCFDFDSALLGQGYVGIPFKLGEKLSITPGMNFSAPLSSVRDGRKREAVWEIVLSYSF